MLLRSDCHETVAVKVALITDVEEEEAMAPRRSAEVGRDGAGDVKSTQAQEQLALDGVPARGSQWKPTARKVAEEEALHGNLDAAHQGVGQQEGIVETHAKRGSG